ncbi:hypothetical protein BDV18DRAFT_162929 [Aspergillus unguis]
MSRNKDIAKQVKELVWDVSQEVGLDINKQHLLLDQSPGNRAALNRLMQRLGTVREHGLDFQVLLTVLPRFPNLISVTFAQIMTPWMTVWHNVGFLPHDRSAFYDSPAMRAWVKLGIGPVYPILYSPSRHFPTRLVKYIHAWAASFVNPWYRQGLPTCRMPQLRHSSSREPVLLLVALYTLGKQLRELHVESFMSSRWHKLFRTNSFTHYHGLDTPAFTTIFQKTPQFLDAFKPLEHLSLSVGSERMRTFTTMWKASLGSVLKRAPNVRVLYIRLGAQAFDNLNLRDIEECTRLEELNWLAKGTFAPLPDLATGQTRLESGRVFGEGTCSIENNSDQFTT